MRSGFAQSQMSFFHAGAYSECPDFGQREPQAIVSQRAIPSSQAQSRTPSEISGDSYFGKLICSPLHACQLLNTSAEQLQ